MEHLEKEFYRVNEVCQATDTQPYVLRFWESEFPQLSSMRRGGAQRMYRREDLDLVRRIKQLLYEESYTLEDARKQLESESTHGRGGRKPPAAARPAAPPEARPAVVERAPTPTVGAPVRESAPVALGDGVSRQRYDDAVDEIEHLRLKLRETDKGRHKAEAKLEELQKTLERERQRAERALAALEDVLRVLS